MDFSFVTDPRFKELDRDAQRRVFDDIAGADDRLTDLDREARGRVLDDAWQGVMVPEDRGTLGRLGSKFVRGVGSAVDLAGGAVQMFDAEAKDQGTIADLVGGKIRKAGEWIAGTEMAQPDKFELSGKEGWIEKSVGGAAESLPSSLAPWGAAAAGAAIGGAIGGPFAPVTATAGGIIGMGAGLFGLFGAGTYKTEYDKVSKERQALGDTPDTADKVAADTAFRMAFGETAGEMAGDAAAYLIFGRSGKLAKDTLESTMKSLVSTGGLKQFAKNVGKDIPFEVGSEIGTAAYQAEAYQKAGLPTMSPADAAIEAIGPALFLSVGIGGAVQGKTALDGRALLRDLNDMRNPKGRAAAAGEMATSLRGKLQDKSVADAWEQTAFGYIERGEEIPVNSTVADFASQHKVTQDDTEPPDSIMGAKSVDEAIQAAQDTVHRRAEMSATPAISDAMLEEYGQESAALQAREDVKRVRNQPLALPLPPGKTYGEGFTMQGQEAPTTIRRPGTRYGDEGPFNVGQEQNPAVVYSRPFKSKSGAIMSLNQRKRAGSLVGDYDVVPTKDGMWRIESVGQGTAKELPERLAAAVGKPEQVKTLEQMGVIDPEAQTKEIVRDAITQHMDIATMLRNRGLETEANKHEAIAKENGEKLKVADGATTERVVDAALETSKNKKEVVPGGEETYDAYGREEGRQGEGLLSPSTVEPVSATAPALSPITIEPYGSGIIVKGDTAQVRAKLSASGVKPKGFPNVKKGGLVFTERQSGAVRAALDVNETPVRETQADLSIKSEKQKEAPNAQTDQVVLATPVPETGEDAPAVKEGNKGNEGGVSDAAAGGVKVKQASSEETTPKQEDAAQKSSNPASEMTAAELLRAAADRIDAEGKAEAPAATEKPAEGQVEREDAMETEEPDKGERLYSQTTTKTGTTVAQVETELRAFLKRGYDKLTGSGKLRVVQSVAELEKLQPSSAKGSSDSLSGHTKMFSNFIKGNPGIHEADGLVNVPREPSAKRDTFDPMVMKIGSYGVLGSPDEIRNLLDSDTIDKEIFGSFDVKRNSIIPSVSRVSPNTGQPSNDSVRRDLEMLRNLLNSKTYTKKGVGGFNTPTQLFVISRVAHVVQNNQVFEAVVSSIPVDMMNVLMGEKISPKVVSHYKSMLLSALTSPNINHDISTAVYRSLSKVLSHLSPHEINSVYNDIFSIPQGEDTVKSIGGIAGSYYNGVMVLVADHIKNGDVKNILLHEGLHSLMREDAIFSKQHDAILDQFEAKRKYDYRVQDAFRKVPKTEAQLREEMEGLPKNTDRAKEIRRMLDRGDFTPEHLVREEALAYFVQEKSNHETSLFKKILANIRMWLMRMGIPLKNLTTDDLVAMVVQGVRRMENQDHIVDGNKMVGDLAPALFSKASSPDDLLAKVKGVGSVAKQGKIENELPIEERWQKVQRVMQDKYNRWGVIKEWAEKQGFAFTDASDVPAHLDTMNGRIADQLLRFMEQTIEPLLERAAKIGATNEQIEKFLLAQHAKEANARAQKLHDNPGALAYGMTDEQAATIMATRGDDFKALANDFRKLSDDTLDMQLEAGVISQESYDAMKGAYKLYVPVRGGDDDIKRGTGKGLTVGRDSKRRGGHGEREEHVLENIVKMREFAVRQIEKNKTALSIKEMLTEMSDERVGTVGKPELTRVFKDKPSFTVLFQNSLAGVFDNEIDADRFVDKALASKMGTLDDYLIKTSTDPRISMMATPLLADNEIAYYESGKRGRIQLNDEGLAKASTHRDLDQLGTILQIGRTFNNYLSRAYTGYDPRFTIRNTFRDFTAGMINVTGDYGIGLAGKVAKAYPAMAKELWSARKDPAVSKWVDMYRQDGGSTGASYLPSIDRLGNKLQNIFEEKIGAIETYKKVYAEQIAMGKNAKMAGLIASSKSGMAGMKKVPVLGHALKVIERMNAISENAFRLAVYKTVYEQTNSRMKAAQAAKNSTLNFDKKGELGPQLSALWLFYNPAAQSMHRTLHTLLASEHKHQAQALVGSMVMTGLIAAMAFGDDDDEWDAIPKATKNRNLILGVGGGAPYITLPLPYEYGAFVGIGYAMADAMRGKATAATGVNLASAIVEGMSPFGNPITEQGNLSAYQMMPTAVQMITAPETNMNSFGGPIAPKKFDEGAPDFQNMWKASQDSAYASIARGLTKATGGNDYEAGLIDVSPETLKYYARGLMGGAFTFMDQVLHAGRVAAAGEVPDLYETPMVNVLGRKTSVRDYQSRFFEEAAEIKRKASAYKDALKNRDFAAAREIGDPSLLRAAKKIEKISKMVGAKRKAIAAIRMDDSLNFEAKRRMITRIEEEEKDLLMKVVGD